MLSSWGNSISQLLTTDCTILAGMDINDWLNTLKGTDSMRQASQKSGYAQTTLQRQVDKGSLSPEMVIALCRAYDRPAAQGLIETGYLYEYEIEGIDVAVALQEATNEQLLAEINRRSDPQARYLFTNDLDDDVVDVQEDAEVIDFPDRMSTPADTTDDGLVDEFDYSEPHAADSSPDETEEMLGRGEDFID